MLPLDDCLYALQPTIPHLTRSSLHRCLQRHGISRLPQVEGEASAKRKFKAYPIGYFHIDIAEVRTAQGKLYLLVAIDRTSKFAFVEMHEKVARRTAGDFLRRLIAAVPYKVHTVLTDNGTHFTTPGNTSSAAPDIKAALEAGELVWAHAFEYACAQNDIDHRLTKPKHPWTNGQVERMNRTIKDATVKRYFYETHDQLRAHLRDFVDAYNFARRLKTLRGLTPYEFICKAWTSEPQQIQNQPAPANAGTKHLGKLGERGFAALAQGIETLGARDPAGALETGAGLAALSAHGQQLSPVEVDARDGHSVPAQLLVRSRGLQERARATSAPQSGRRQDRKISNKDAHRGLPPTRKDLDIDFGEQNAGEGGLGAVPGLVAGRDRPLNQPDPFGNTPSLDQRDAARPFQDEVKGAEPLEFGVESFDLRQSFARATREDGGDRPDDFGLQPIEGRDRDAQTFLCVNERLLRRSADDVDPSKNPIGEADRARIATRLARRDEAYREVARVLDEAAVEVVPDREEIGRVAKEVVVKFPAVFQQLGLLSAPLLPACRSPSRVRQCRRPACAKARARPSPSRSATRAASVISARPARSS